MLAASFWSLLQPAIELAEASELYVTHTHTHTLTYRLHRYGSFFILPVAFGFVGGALFVHMADVYLTEYMSTPSAMGMAVKRVDMKEHHESKEIKAQFQQSWRRMTLMVIAITVHNFPGLSISCVCVINTINGNAFHRGTRSWRGV